MNKKSENPLRYEISVKIRQAREKSNYTQEYVANLLNISQNAYSKIELGVTRLSVERLLQIAEVLQCDPWDLVIFKKMQVAECI